MTIIAEAITESLERSSWIRRMFEEGGRMKKEFGAENVFDFSLGNPIVEPPAKVHQVLKDLLAAPPAGMHRYIPNSGLPEVREYVARSLTEDYRVDYGAEQVVITCGAAGGLNIVLKALLNPGDEVLTLAPYFTEYDFYAANHGGSLVRVPTQQDFKVDLEALEKAIGPKSRALIINSPNNPTGVVYDEASIRGLAEVLKEASQKQGRPIVLLSDEPYRHLVFDGVTVPWVPHFYEHSIVIHSHSKDLGLAGERVGYVAVSPGMADLKVLMDALVLANRVLGFVNAPALVQRLLPHLRGEQVDVDYYRANRDGLMKPLQEMGYQMNTPRGGFFLFPKSPIEDDVAFVKAAQQEKLLLVPGSGFGGPGHFRISLAVTPDVIERSLPVFEKIFKAVQ